MRVKPLACNRTPPGLSVDRVRFINNGCLE
jgi:hypothetical protein